MTPATRRPSGGSLRLPAAVVLLLVAVYLIASGTQSHRGTPTAGTPGATPAAAARTVPVTAVTRSCPPPAPGTGHASVAMVAASTTAASTTPASRTHASTTAASTTGKATLTAVPYAAANSGGTASPAKGSTSPAPGTAPAPVTAPITRPNAATVMAAPQASAGGATQLAATGTLAAGFEAEQSNSSGLGAVACTHATSDAWFVGTGQGAGANAIRLYLTNPGDMPAAVNLTVLTDAGPETSPQNNLTVAPHRYTSMNLASVVSGSQVLAVHVQTSSGQVAANVWESGAWLPVAQAPATQLVIPGLTASGGAAKLFVAVPGGKDAQVSVTALTAQGKLQPLGKAPVDATAASASTYALNSLGASASALVLTSSVPVVAGAQVPGSGIGGFTAAVQPVTEQGVVAGNPSGGGNSVAVVLSAPSAAARAAISVIPGSSDSAGPASQHGPGQSAVRAQSVSAGRTAQVTVSVPKGVRGPFAVVVTPLPGSGPLYAARAVLSGSGTLLSLLPVPSAVTAVRLPPVADSYTAVSGG